MDHILQAIEGPFTYVVIGEVSVICALFLVLLYLIVKRTLQPIPGYSGVTELPSVPANVTAPAPAPESLDDAEVKANAGSKRSVEPTEEEILQKGYPDVPTYYSFKDKVKYLESKLLEYEILQEEIGTLSGLKMENEHLKNKLEQLEAEIEKLTASASVPASPAAAEASAKNPAEKVTEKPPEVSESITVPANSLADHATEAELIAENTAPDEKRPSATLAVASSDPVPASATPTETSNEEQTQEPDAKMDTGTAVESTSLEPTLNQNAVAASEELPEPRALGQAGVEGEPSEPNDEPPVLDGILDQLDHLAKEKAKKKKRGA